MLLLGQINNPRACKAFTDYLSVKKIAFQVQAENDELAIFVSESEFAVANQLYQEFVANPNQEKYLQASWQLNQPVAGQTQSLGLNKIWQANGPLTKLITVVCISIYCLSIFGYFGAIFNNLSFSMQAEQWYRLVTPAFMHLSAMHLVFNMSWWWYLGGKVEKHFSIPFLLAITLGTALVSNVLQAYLVNSNFAGLSGVNYGLAGFVWLYGRLSNSPTVNLANNIFGFLVVWMLLGFADILPINMANWAHLFGLLTGLAVAKLVYKKADH